MGQLLEGTDGCFVLMAMLQTGSEIELEVQTSAEKGRGVAKVDGFVVFVRYAVPGDRVLARIVKSTRNFAEAVSVKLLVPSSQRVEPRCRYFGVCGGCGWQNLSYEAQLKLKRHRVEDAFNHIGGFKTLEVKPTLGSDDDYFYRHKMEF
ncbi:MAG: class I SAM-dependent RNA methyltransferase, partial [Bacteroidota bacterium]